MISYTTGREIMLIKALVEKRINELHLTEAYVYKGTVNSVAELPSSGNKAGDVYNIGADLNGDNYVWTGSDWDILSGSIASITTTQIDTIME